MDKKKEITHTNDGNDFSELMRDFDMKSIDYATPINGTIIEIDNNKVVIDIGRKTEGILNKTELLDWNGDLNYKVGDSINVICKRINRKQGYITVSKKELDIKEGWEKVQRAYERNISVIGKIIKVLPDNKGFLVDMGVEMFLPMSQADIKKVKAPQKLLGREFWFKVNKLNQRDETGVISRRVLLEEERKEKIDKLINSLKVGDIVKGIITTITDYGAFINLGGIDGLIHKEDISYGRIGHPKEKLRNGDEVEAKILNIDKERKKISLGLKQKYLDPWIDIGDKYPVGKRVIAKVTKIVDFGAFIELEEGVEGLLHVSDLTWEGRPKSVEEYVAVGDKPWVQVIELNKDDKKIKLGLKQLEMRPEEKYLEKHEVGEIVKGVVKKVLDSKVFIELEEGVEGVVKISDIRYFRIDSAKDFFKEREKVESVILSDELDFNYKVRVGIKQLSDDEWKDFFKKSMVGSVIEVKIKNINENGIVVEISKNIEGFVRLNEIDEERLTIEEINKNYKIGEKREALVTRTLPDKRRIYLSFRAVNKKREREEIEKYSKSNNESSTTVGDLFESAIVKKK
jgi:small subunit ribosomal protein S1